MPFLPEDKTLSDARKEAASAGFKSMTQAAMSAEDKAKNMGNRASNVQDLAWGPSQPHDFKEKFGVEPYEISHLMNDKVSKHLTMSPDMKREYEAAMERDAGASKAGDVKAQTRASADVAIGAAQNPPRRAQD